MSCTSIVKQSANGVNSITIQIDVILYQMMDEVSGGLSGGGRIAAVRG